MSESVTRNVNDALSVWRSPLDQVALNAASSLAERQPRCSIVPNEDLSAMTVYNYQFYVAQAVVDPPVTGLSNMLAAMSLNDLGNVGGVAFIPQLKAGFTIDSIPIGGFLVPDQCNIFASGTGGKDDGADFYHFIITPTGHMTFLSCSGGAYTTGGTHFQGIAFHWLNSGDPTDTCILAAMQNCTAIRCTFTDCPVAFDAQAPGCALKQCTIFYKTGSPAGATAVKLASSQCAIIGPGELEQDPVYAKGGPACCTCISIQSGADHALVTDTHVSNWSLGIDFSQGGGSTNTQIRNCEIQSYLTAINIVNSDGAPITGVKVTSSMLSRENDSNMSMMATPVVVIDPGGYGNDAISDVTLLGCTVYMMADASSSSMAGQHGLKILGGTNIKVLGGTYSNNNPASGAGIAITGACGDVQIIGANLQPMYDNGTPKSTTQCQAYGLLVSSNPAPNMTILVRDCDMRGYDPSSSCGVAAVYTTGVTRGLYINDCLGYNDQNTSLTATSLTAPSMAATCSTPYFGPSVITFTNPSPVALNIDGQVLLLTFGVVFLASPYDSFFFTTVPHGFTWYGK